MYRIKFERDLEELRQFKYKKDAKGNYSKKVMKDTNKAWAYFETIEINKDDRIIRTRLYQDAADQEWVGYIEKEGRYIHDIYEAGLIEEVHISKPEELRQDAFQYLRNKNKELKQQHELAIKTLQRQYKEQIDGLKETIVTMTVHSYTAQESFFNTIRDIDKKLNLIIDWRNKNND